MFFKNNISLKIEKPCDQNFKDFSKTPKGGYCQLCCKEVIDFTTMPDKAIGAYFKTSKNNTTCARLSAKQLQSTFITAKNKKPHIITRITLACIAFFSVSKMQGQQKKETPIKKQDTPNAIEQAKNIPVKGHVRDHEFPLPGVSIVLEGTAIGTETDFDGNFSFPEPLKQGDVLIFHYIGMQAKKVTITKPSNTEVFLEIDLKLDPDIILMGKVASKKIYRSKKK